MQVTLAAVNGSRVGGFFVKVVPLGVKRISVYTC